MKLQRPAILGVSSLLAVMVGCGGGPEPSSSSATGSVRQGDTVAPLWTATHKGWPGGVSVYGAGVDDDGSTYVMAHTTSQDNLVVVFDPNGAYVRTVGIVSGEFAGPTDVRVRGGAFVTNWSQPNASRTLLAHLVYYAPGATGPTWSYVSTGESQSAGSDLCADGSVVLATWSRAAGPQVMRFDGSGNALSTTSLPAGGPSSKVRCLGSGAIVVAGTTLDSTGSTPISATLARLGSDGTLQSTWTSSDTSPNVQSSQPTFDVIGGTTYVARTLTANGASQYVVYAVGRDGSLAWSWTSGGTADTLAGISTSDVVTVTGARGADGYTVQLDTGGNVLWTRDDPSAPNPAGVALDDGDETFLCSPATEALYDTAGSTVSSDGVGFVSMARADVTNAIGRCVGMVGNNYVGVVAFQVQ